MADRHVTLTKADGTTETVRYIDTQTIQLQSGSKAASALVANDVLADGRTVTSAHTADVTAGSRNISQAGFRGRNDDGTETTASWKAAENTNWSQEVNTPFRVRFVINDTGSLSTEHILLNLEYNLQSQGWVSVNPTSSVVRPAASPNVANDTDTTRQLVSGSGTFQYGEVDTDNAIAVVVDGGTLNAGGVSEVEFCVQIIGADVANNDTVQLRIRYSSFSDFGAVPLDAYTQTPSVTVIKAV